MSFHVPFEVVHDIIGVGTAVAIQIKDNNRVILVEFGDKTLEFTYPGQFCFHLRATNPLIQGEILQDLARYKPNVFEIITDTKETRIRFKKSN